MFKSFFFQAKKRERRDFPGEETQFPNNSDPEENLDEKRKEWRKSSENFKNFSFQVFNNGFIITTIGFSEKSVSFPVKNIEKCQCQSLYFDIANLFEQKIKIFSQILS